MTTQTHNRGSTREPAERTLTQAHPEQPPRRQMSGARDRAKKRRRRLMMFYAFVFLMVIAAAVALSLTVLFKIDTIEVSGSTRYSAQEIINASGIEKGTNLFLTNTSQAGAAVEKKLPYIGTVTVSRVLPAKISITVHSAEISGAVAYNGGYVLVSSEGKVLEQVNTLPNNCQAVIGLELSSAPLGGKIVCKNEATKAIYEELVSVLEKNKLDKITKIDISNTYRILVEYDKRITMNLGLASSIDYKIRFAKSIFDSKKIADNEKGILNLSVAEQDNKVYFDPDETISSSASSSGAGSAGPSSSSGTSSRITSSSSRASSTVASTAVSSGGTAASSSVTGKKSVSSAASSGVKQ